MKIDPQLLKYLSLINQIGIHMIIPIFFCLLIGRWLDQKFNYENMWTLIFIFLGVLTAMRNLFVVTSKFIGGQKGPKK